MMNITDERPLIFGNFLSNLNVQLDVIGARRAPTDSLFLVGSSMIHAFRRILIAFLPYVFCLVRRSVPVTPGLPLSP